MPEDRTDVNNFFLYLKGEDGKNGATIVLGAPNVIIQYYGDPDLKEYVDWEDGSVTYKIYDASGKGTVVKGIPESNSEYKVDNEGFITVPKDDLPKNKAYENIAVEVKLDGEADFKSSANNTIVPAKMQVRLVINEEKTPASACNGAWASISSQGTSTRICAPA